LYRGINDLKNGYQPRSNIVTDKQGDLFTNSHTTWARRRNHFSQPLNVHGVNDIKQIEIHTTEPLVPATSAFVVEMATEKLKDTNHQILIKFPAELIKAGGRTFCSEIQQLINSIWNKDKLTEEWKELMPEPIYMGDKTECSNYRGILLLATWRHSLASPRWN